MALVTYTVAERDNLTKIAARHNTTVDSLVKLNNIKDRDTIYVGQKLIFEDTLENGGNTIVHDSSQNKPKEQAFLTKYQEALQKKTELENTVRAKENMLPYVMWSGIAGAATVKLCEKLSPAAKNAAKASAEILHDASKSAAKKANMAKEVSMKNAQSVKRFIAQKTKHIAKSVELNYAFVKDATQKRTKSMFASVSQKLKHTAKAAELNYTFAKDAITKKGKSLVKTTSKKIKLNGRYVRLVGNTKVAPALLKGASKAAIPATALFATYEINQAYKNGGADAAIKQTIKTGGGLAVGWVGMKAGAAIGTALGGPIGTVIGGIVGGFAGYLAGEKLLS